MIETQEGVMDKFEKLQQTIIRVQLRLKRAVTAQEVVLAMNELTRLEQHKQKLQMEG
jgi:hypothetical protein